MTRFCPFFEANISIHDCLCNYRAFRLYDKQAGFWILTEPTEDVRRFTSGSFRATEINDQR